jgi:hypothetical protein
MIFQKHRFLHSQQTARVGVAVRVRSTCARCNCHCELTKTRNSETQWRGSPCRFDQRLDCCSVFYVFWKYYSWLGKTGVRLLYKRWTPKSSGICAAICSAEAKTWPLVVGRPEKWLRIWTRRHTGWNFLWFHRSWWKLMRTPNTTRRKVKRDTPGLLLQNVLT